MNTSYAKAETLTSAVLAPLDLVRSLALVVAFSLLTALAAQVVIPLPLVPITGQTFAVLLTGALLGSRLGALAMIAYLIEGASGLPFFYAGGSGVQHLLFSPTSGYLVAYPLAAFVVGLLSERGWDRRFLTAAAAMALGSVVILLGGWAWLARFVSPTAAFSAGVAPFLLGDL
ncbi:MAG TPA: biotin transporter BioY, partial [Pyrinomonadaceae bacterium]|nr:biotin transporter BioY [Pyrinomonadaceae bacterium]